jgi:hypothetical protein
LTNGEEAVRFRRQIEKKADIKGEHPEKTAKCGYRRDAEKE